MTGSLLGDAFDHHTWATLRLIDACAELNPEQLETAVPGTYGTIIGTFRHIVGADSWYRFRLLGDRYPPMAEEEEAQMDLAQVRAAVEEIAASWPGLLARELDADEVVPVHRDDGSETHAPIGIRIAQILHHGTDHRSQICTALTQLGIEPPEIDLWAYGVDAGRVTEIPPTS